MEEAFELLGYSSQARADLISCIPTQPIMERAAVVSRRLGPFAPYAPWLGPDFVNWQGPLVIYELDAAFVAAL